MGRTLINMFDAWQIFLLVTFMAVSYTIAVRYIFKHFFPAYVLKKRDNISIYISVLITGEAILIAFTIIVLWQTYTTTAQYVSQEASELAKIIIDSHSFPPKQQNVIVTGVKNYIKLVREEEWRFMRVGERSVKTQQVFEDLYFLLSSISFNNEIEKMYYHEILTNLNRLLEARRFRLERVESNIPAILLSVIVISSLSLVGLLAILKETKNTVSNGLVYLIACILALYLSLILLLDYPFSGEIAVSSKPFTQGILAKVANSF